MGGGQEQMIERCDHLLSIQPQLFGDGLDHVDRTAIDIRLARFA